MRREDGFQRRDDEPTRPVRVPRLRLAPETDKILEVALDPSDSSPHDVSAARSAR